MIAPTHLWGARQYRRTAAAFALSVLLLIIVLLLWLSPLIYAQDLPPIRYSSTSNIITIGRPYLPLITGEGPFVTNPSHPDAPKLHLTLPQLRQWAIENNEPNLIRDVGNGIWEIAADIDVEDNAQFDLTAASGVKEVRLISRPDASYNLITDGGTLFIDGIKLYSWDNSPGVNTYDQTFLTVDGVTQTRSFLAALYGGRMDIKNAEIMYLGHEELNSRVGYGKGEPSGLAWRLRPPGTTDPESGPKGSVINSNVHHNYFGMYSYEAVRLEIRNSEFHHHYFYGLDPHDYSFGFVVANNTIHDNGYTGLIFSRHCTDNEVYGNEIYNNHAHGFMLDRGSNNNLVYDNTIYHNSEDGVAIYQSSGNRVYENRIYDNGRYGVRVSAEYDVHDLYDGLALENVIQDNMIANSGRDGIYVTDRADRTYILDNDVHDNFRVGLLLNSGLSLVQGNRFFNNGREGILVDDEAYTAGSGEHGTSLPPIGVPGTANQLLANHVISNAAIGIEIDLGSANRIGSLGAGNIISGNIGGGLVLNFTGATIVDSNEIYNNVAGNGAGISAKCDAQSPVMHQIIGNVITGNVVTDNKGRGAGIYLTAGCFAQINGNRLHDNRNNSYVANLQNDNLAAGPTIDATDNIWALTDTSAIEETIWHSNDDNRLSTVNFLPIGTGPVAPPPTPSPTPTPDGLVTPTPTPTIVPTLTPVGNSGLPQIYLPSIMR